MQISLASVFSSLIDFVKHPRLKQLSDHFFEKPQKIFPYLLAIDFLLMIPLSGLIGLVGIDEANHKVAEMFSDPLTLALMAILAAPFFEEALFRYPIGKFFNQNFRTIFWLFTIGFAAMHFFNFSGDVPIYFAPLLVLPQFVLGIVLGYIRVGWGFWYSVLFHALHNGILVGLALLGKALGGG